MKKSKNTLLSIPAFASGQVDLEVDTAPSTGTRVSRLARTVARKLLEALGNPPFALVLWNGEAITTHSKGPKIRIHIRDRGALYRLISNPSFRFGDLFSAGRIEIEGDLVQFLEYGYQGIADPRKLKRLSHWHSQLFNRASVNTVRGSRSNIHHHYDLGNDFYKLWLDTEAMQYTCAYYPDLSLTLEQAQIAKIDHVCRKLRLKPGDRVVEAGCGWGGFARYIAKHYGVRVRAYNISHEQIVFARERAKNEGLEGRLEYIEDDYRTINDQYDVFVSIGMLEHVGTRQYRDLGQVIDRCLTPEGCGLIHSIGRNKPAKMNPWIEKRIFPGAYPATLREMMAIFEPYNLSVLDVENLRLHYAQTLRQWLVRYEQHSDAVEAMFDPLFVRAWRLYLAGSIAAFTTGKLQLFQILFNRGTNNDVPASRGYIYQQN